MGQSLLAAIDGFADFWHCLFSNTYPQVFLKNVLGLPTEMEAVFPKYLKGFLALYLLCGIITVVLRFLRKQRSLNSVPKQINNIILTAADFFFIPQLAVFVSMGRQALAEVAPYGGELSDLVRFSGQAWTAIYPALLLFLVVLCTVLLPFQAALRYLRVYRLRGLPHMVFDVGTGLFLISSALLSMCAGDRRWYLPVLAAVILLGVVQSGGYVPAERNAQQAKAPSEPKT